MRCIAPGAPLEPQRCRKGCARGKWYFGNSNCLQIVSITQTLYCLHTAHEHRSHAVTTSAQKAVPVGLNSDFRWVSRRGSPGTSPTAASAPLVRLRKRGFFASAPDSDSPFNPFSRSVTHSTERHPGPGGALPMSGSPVTSPIPSLNTLHLSPTFAGGRLGTWK